MTRPMRWLAVRRPVDGGAQRCLPSVRRRHQPPPAANPAAKNPHLGNPQSIRSGMALYRIRCADCHGLDAGGYRGPDLIAAMAAGATDERLFQTIRKGVPGTEMPAARKTTRRTTTC